MKTHRLAFAIGHVTIALVLLWGMGCQKTPLKSQRNSSKDIKPTQVQASAPPRLEKNQFLLEGVFPVLSEQFISGLDATTREQLAHGGTVSPATVNWLLRSSGSGPVSLKVLSFDGQIGEMNCITEGRDGFQIKMKVTPMRQKDESVQLDTKIALVENQTSRMLENHRVIHPNSGEYECLGSFKQEDREIYALLKIDGAK
jgi:hypothetical protein